MDYGIVLANRGKSHHQRFENVLLSLIIDVKAHYY